MKARELGTSYKISPKVSIHPLNWVRKDIIFFAEQGPFPACLKRFELAHNDFCTCGGHGRIPAYLKRYRKEHNDFCNCKGILNAEQ
ncbi:hypothetical protein AVEN_204582-1 [Araneus ventricosus]|uniref:Uncharacterized protein n=1 Tax=Araneus ventricosus TaxID=182803 RepID=A0A4Y2RZV6_ARAVE|nr:hypothetical protein AVEN_204582-1 [Araneus ventricosus]